MLIFVHVGNYVTWQANSYPVEFTCMYVELFNNLSNVLSFPEHPGEILPPDHWCCHLPRRGLKGHWIKVPKVVTDANHMLGLSHDLHWCWHGEYCKECSVNWGKCDLCWMCRASQKHWTDVLVFSRSYHMGFLKKWSSVHWSCRSTWTPTTPERTLLSQ